MRHRRRRHHWKLYAATGLLVAVLTATVTWAAF